MQIKGIMKTKLIAGADLRRRDRIVAVLRNSHIACSVSPSKMLQRNAMDAAARGQVPVQNAARYDICVSKTDLDRAKILIRKMNK